MARQNRPPRHHKNDHRWYKTLVGARVGTWELNQYIGCGKVGAVYKASSTQVEERVAAIKIFMGPLKEGWQTELNKVSKLNLVNGVVPFHHLDSTILNHKGKTQSICYTVWEFIPPGRSLKDFLSQTDACPASFLLAVLETVLSVLHACQKKGVERHGDLHPGNILIGEPDEAQLDERLQPRAPIYVSDFGYGTTGAVKQPKDDFQGLAIIADAILRKVNWDHATATDRRIIMGLRDNLPKLLKEGPGSDRQQPIEILRFLKTLKREARLSAIPRPGASIGSTPPPLDVDSPEPLRVGQFQVSEMLGDNWELWKRLFVPRVPARSRLLEPDITTVVTGPRGCGKTMLFRRLSERLMLECGPIVDTERIQSFVGFYVNANDIADAFSFFPKNPRPAEAGKLICYANLCILAEVLTVESARQRLTSIPPNAHFMEGLAQWVRIQDRQQPLITYEDELERFRLTLEHIKWNFPTNRFIEDSFPGQADLSRHDWIRVFVRFLRSNCDWIGNRRMILFIDDYSTPRVSTEMQKVLNRLWFQRGSDFIVKIATEAATTFIAQDSSEKLLQDGDDYQLIDMASESLFMNDRERAEFLNDVFHRRLSIDMRVPDNRRTLPDLLGQLGMKKTPFARLLRGEITKDNVLKNSQPSERRGATKARALYHGHDVFTGLWSGDTRIMIQLIQEIVDEAYREDKLSCTVRSELQDRIFRNRGGDWLDVQTRNQPTNPELFEQLISQRPGFRLVGDNYGMHLKAIVEAFKEAARQLLLGPIYKMTSGERVREVPRMAFRIEITDKFRLEGLEAEIYKDLVRYGLFLRDNRGKSVQGAMVPRLFLRRLLLPYCVLALSKRDSVQMNCSWFCKLLAYPDLFAREWPRFRESHPDPAPEQMAFLFPKQAVAASEPDAGYDDLADEDEDDES